MKITIESEELFFLREKLADKVEEINELRARLKELDEENIERRVKSLSWKLFEKYLELTFRKLGFDKPPFHNSVVACGVWQQLGETWFEKEDEITMSLAADLEEDFRHAFLRIGVVDRPKEKSSKFLEKLGK